MPPNLYGPNDNIDLSSSHVLPALIAKAHAAKLEGKKALPLWGTGTPLREFAHVDDCADAIVFITKHYSAEEHINLGSGQEISIAGLANLIMKIVGLEGGVEFDRSKPDGTPRKLLDSRRLLSLGWTPRISLEEGIRSTYAWYIEHVLK